MLHIPTTASYNAETGEMKLGDYIEMSAEDFIDTVLKPVFPGDLNGIGENTPIRFDVKEVLT